MKWKSLFVVTAVLVLQQTALSAHGYVFDADGTVIHYDRFNTVIGEVGIEKGRDRSAGNNHIIFSYRGKGVYAPEIILGEEGIS